MRKALSIIPASLALLALAACGAPAAEPAASSAPESSSSQSTPSGTPVEGDETVTALKVPGKFWFATQSGAFAKFDLPTDGPADVEKLRKTVGAKPLTYIRVVVDARKASSFVRLPPINGFTDDGQKIEFTQLNDIVAGWANLLDADSPEYAAMYKAKQTPANISNKMNYKADAGEVVSIWMATEQKVPAEFAGMTTDVDGTGDPANILSQDDAQGAPLDFTDPDA